MSTPLVPTGPSTTTEASVTAMWSTEIGDAGPSRSASCSCFLINRAIDQASPSRLRYTIGRLRRMSSIDIPRAIIWKTL
jgi:hypothetical protein